MKLKIKSIGSDGFRHSDIFDIIKLEENRNINNDGNESFSIKCIYTDGFNKHTLIYDINSLLIYNSDKQLKIIENIANIESLNNTHVLYKQVDIKHFSKKKKTKQIYNVSNSFLQLDVITKNIFINKLSNGDYNIKLDYDIYQFKDKINNMKVLIKIQK